MPTLTKEALSTHRWLILAVSLSIIFVVAPLVAMQFSESMNWGIADFVIAGALPLFTYFLYYLSGKITKNPLYRAIIGVTLVLSVVLVIVELAVGIFD